MTSTEKYEKMHRNSVLIDELLGHVIDFSCAVCGEDMKSMADTLAHIRHSHPDEFNKADTFPKFRKLVTMRWVRT